MLKNISNVIDQSISWLLSTQNSDGGLPYDDSGDSSGTWNTAGVLWAISNVPSDNTCIDYTAIKNAFVFLIKSFNKDGLIPFSKKGDCGGIDATAQYLLAISAFLEKNPKFERLLKPTVLRAVSALLSCSKDNYWSFNPNGEISLFSTAIVIMALEKSLPILPNDELVLIKNVRKTIKCGIKHLIADQKEDGGWGGIKFVSSQPGITAMVIHSLSLYTGQYTDTIKKGIKYLLDTQLPDGSWRDTIERSLGVTVIRFSTPYCVSAIIKSGVGLVDEHFQKSLKWMMQKFKDGKMYYESLTAIWPTRDALLALCEIVNAISMEQFTELISYNISIVDEKLKLEKKLNEQNVIQNKEIKKAVEEHISHFNSKYTFLKIAFIVFVVIIFSLGTWLFILYKVIETNTIFVLIPIYLTIIGLISSAIFRKD